MRRYIFLALFSTLAWAHQAADPTQQQRDTPTPHPGTESPDTSQRQPAPGKDKGGAKNGTSSKGTDQQPGTNNPDIAKRNAPKKTKHKTATSTATAATPKQL